MANHRRFIAWQHAHRLAIAIYQITKGWPREERYGLTAQVRSAATSVGANIAEGAGRLGPAEFKRFLNIALGSLSELESHLEVARDVGILSNEDWKRLQGMLERTAYPTRRLARKL